VINLIGGEDTELGAARKNMDTCLSRLQSATEYAILGNTEEMQRMNQELKTNSDQQLEMMHSQKAMLENVIEKQDSVHNEIINIKKLLVAQVQRKEESKSSGGAKGVSKTKPPTSNRVRGYFDEKLNPESEFHNIIESFIPGTGNWIFSEELWSQWLSQEKAGDDLPPRILALSGPPGSGKSNLAASAVEYLQKHIDDNTCVAHFYFRETTKDFNEFYNSINWTVIQIAEQNDVLCRKINYETSRDELIVDTSDWKQVWSHLLAPLFPKTSQYRLRIVLDGLDELKYLERDKLFDFLKTFNETPELNISIVCTIRSDLVSRVQEHGAQVIEVTKEKQSSDLNALIWNHLNHDSGLRRFSRYVKQRISTALEEKADCKYYKSPVNCYNIILIDQITCRYVVC
jgi:nucleoside-triphosphatase THEP1